MSTLIQNVIIGDFRKFLTSLSENSGFDQEKFFELVRLNQQSVSSVSSEVLTQSSQSHKCDYVFQKGKNPGKVCESIAVDNTTKCRKHSKFEGATAVLSNKSSKFIEVSENVKPQTIRAGQIAIKENSYGNREHKATNLVFNSDKKVYGKQVGDKVLPLSSIDIENCKRHNFKWEESCVVKPESLSPEEFEEEVEEIDAVEEIIEDEILEDEDEEVVEEDE